MQNNPMVEPEDPRVYSLARSINWDNLIPSCIELAREIEQFSHMRGKEKLELLIKTLKTALRDSNKSAEEKEQILHTIDTVVPVVIQAAILASKLPIAQIVAGCCCAKK